ncbi:hypothetical protein ZHAS_00015916 [Anopheles sinensis]|uniref:Uncharacterized protein n=1 Tax=Anopheles sinensis TaxID=74873 RepID=A0A084WCB9_ANOSI|nr:hypothetical protein ZHAS_00015916 [Anopheles sinensis]
MTTVKTAGVGDAFFQNVALVVEHHLPRFLLDCPLVWRKEFRLSSMSPMSRMRYLVRHQTFLSCNNACDKLSAMI